MQVVRCAVVVGPAFFAHLLGRRCFDLVEVEERLEGELGLGVWLCTFLGRGILGRFWQCFWIDRSKICFSGEVLFEGTRGVDGIVFFGRVLAGELEDYFAATGMV